MAEKEKDLSGSWLSEWKKIIEEVENERKI